MRANGLGELSATGPGHRKKIINKENICQCLVSDIDYYVLDCAHQAGGKFLGDHLRTNSVHLILTILLSH